MLGCSLLFVDGEVGIDALDRSLCGSVPAELT